MTLKVLLDIEQLPGAIPSTYMVITNINNYLWICISELAL